MLGEGKRAGRVIPGAIGYVLFNYFLPHCIPLVECPSPYASSTPAHRMTALLSSVPVTTLKLERAWVQIPLEMGCDEGSNLESLNFTGSLPGIEPGISIRRKGSKRCKLSVPVSSGQQDLNRQES